MQDTGPLRPGFGDTSHRVWCGSSKTRAVSLRLQPHPVLETEANVDQTDWDFFFLLPWKSYVDACYCLSHQYWFLQNVLLSSSFVVTSFTLHRCGWRKWTTPTLPCCTRRCLSLLYPLWETVSSFSVHFIEEGYRFLAALYDSRWDGRWRWVCYFLMHSLYTLSLQWDERTADRFLKCFYYWTLKSCASVHVFYSIF